MIISSVAGGLSIRFGRRRRTKTLLIYYWGIKAMVLLRLSTVVDFCATFIGGGAVGAEAEITVSVPAGVHWQASPEGMPMWGPNRIWPGSGMVVMCLGPGFTVLALGPG